MFSEQHGMTWLGIYCAKKGDDPSGLEPQLRVTTSLTQGGNSKIRNRMRGGVEAASGRLDSGIRSTIYEAFI